MKTFSEFVREEKKLSHVVLHPEYPGTQLIMKEYFDKYVSPAIAPEKRTIVFRKLMDEYNRQWKSVWSEIDKPLEPAGQIGEAMFFGGMTLPRSAISFSVPFLKRVISGAVSGGTMETVSGTVEESLKDKVGKVPAFIAGLATGAVVGGVVGSVSERILKIPPVTPTNVAKNVVDNVQKEAGVPPSQVSTVAHVSDVAVVDSARKKVRSRPVKGKTGKTPDISEIQIVESAEKVAEKPVAKRAGKGKKVATIESAKITDEQSAKAIAEQRIASKIESGDVNPTMVEQAIETGHIDPSLGISIMDTKTGEIPVHLRGVAMELKKVGTVLNRLPLLDRPYTAIGNIIKSPWFDDILRPLVYEAEETRRIAKEFENTAKARIGKALSVLDQRELDSLGEILYRGCYERTVYKAEQLSQMGLNDKQINAYRTIRNVFDDFANFVERVARKIGMPEKQIKELRELARVPGYFPSTRIDDNIVLTMVKVGDKWKLLDLPSFKTPQEAVDYVRRFYGGSIRPEVLRYASEVLELDRIPMDLSQIGTIIFNKKTGKIMYAFGTQHPLVESVSSFVNFIRRGGTSGLFDSFPLLERAMKHSGVQDEVISKITDAFGNELIKGYARGHFAHKRYVPGAGSNWIEQMLEYFETVPTAFARKAYFSKKFTEHMKTISREAPHLVPYAQRWGEWLMGTRTFSPTALAINSVLYTMYLGLKPFFFAVNYTQRFVTTFWYGMHVGRKLGLSSEDIVRSFLKAEADQWKVWANVVKESVKTKRANWLDAIKNSGLEDKQKKLLRKMFVTGELEQSLPGVLKSGNRVMDLLHVFGSASEKLNRIHTALFINDIYRKAKMLGGLDDAFRKANEANYFCNFLYSASNRPEIARGMLGQIMFLFKTYPVNLMNFWRYLWKNDKTALLGSFATAFALAGRGAIPGWDVISEIALWIGEQFDPTFRGKTYLMSKNIPKFLTDGVPTLIGISGLVQWGNGELFSFAPIPYVQSSTRFMQSVLDPDIPWYQKLRMISPTILKHEISLLTMQEGWPVSAYGRVPLTQTDLEKVPKEIRDVAQEIINGLPKEWPMNEKILYGLGAVSDTLGDYYRAIDAIRKMSARWSREEKAYIRRMVNAASQNNWEEFYRLANEAFENGHFIESRQITQEAKGRIPVGREEEFHVEEEEE